MNVYFAASITRYRKLLPIYQSIVEIIEKLGHTVTSKHVVDEDLTKDRDWEEQYEPEQLVQREKDRLTKADVIVAEMTVPSWGTACMTCHAVNLKKPMLNLYYGLFEHNIPLMLRGNKDLNVHLYTEDTLRKVLTDFFASVKR